MRLTFLLLLLASQEATKVEVPDPLSIRKLSGELRIWRALTSLVEKARETDRVTKDDRMGTEGGASARFSLENRLVVLVKGVVAARDKGLGVARDAKKLRIRIYSGTTVVESFDADFQVDTPHGKVEASSAFVLVETSEDKTRVVAIDGKLTFSNDLGSVQVEPGQTVAAPKGAAPGPAAAADLPREMEWVSREEAPSNLIANPGYEEGLAKWTVVDHEGVTVQTDDSVFHSGKKSCRIAFKRAKIAVGSFSPIGEAAVKEGTRYMMRAFVRSERYTVDDKPGRIAIRSVEVHEGRTGGWHLSRWLPPTDDWRVLRVFFKASSTTFRVQVARNLENEHVYDGTLWVDDWFLTPVPEPAKE